MTDPITRPASTLAPRDGGVAPPLAVHVVWSNGDAGADALAHGLYTYLARDPRRPLERGLAFPFGAGS